MKVKIPITSMARFRSIMEGLDDAALVARRTGAYRSYFLHGDAGTPEIEFNLPFDPKAKPLVKRQAPARKGDSDAV